MAEEAAPENKPSEKPKKKFQLSMKVVVIAVSQTVFFSGLAGAAFFALKRHEKNLAEQAAKKLAEEEAKKPKIFFTDPIPIEASLTNRKGRLFKLSAEIKFEFDNLAGFQEIQSRQSLVKEDVVIFLSAQNPQEIQSLFNKRLIHVQILERINKLSRKGSVQNIYFSNFFLQELPSR